MSAIYEGKVLLGFVIVAAIFSFTFNLPIFSLWETANLYPIHNPLKTPDIRFAINLGGDTSGYWGDYGYIFHRIGRYLTNLFGMDLFTIRILPMLYGVVALVLLYRVVKRASNERTACLAVLLLATNIPFIVFQHSLLPQIFCLLVVLWCVDRYQILSEHYSLKSAIIFGVACSLAAVGYLPGRIMMIVIIGYYASDDLRIFRTVFRLGFKEAISARFKGTFVTIGAMVTTLLILYPKNFFLLFTKNFIFSSLGEYATSSASALENISINVKYLVSFFFLAENKDGITIDIVNNIPYRIDNYVFLLTAIVSVLFCRFIFSNKHIRLLAVMIVVYLAAIMMSMTFPDKPFEISTTLSNYRIFLLIPMVLIVSVACINVVFSQIENKIGLKLFSWVFLCLFGVITLFRLIDVADAKEKTINFVDKFNFAIGGQFSSMPVESFSIREGTQAALEDILDQIYYRKLAETISEKIKIDNKHIVELDGQSLIPNYYKGGGKIPSANGAYKEYFDFFMMTYLRHLGVDVGYLKQKNKTYGDRRSTFEKISIKIKHKLGFIENDDIRKKEIPGEELSCDDYKVHGAGLSKPDYLLVSTGVTPIIERCIGTWVAS